MKASSPQLILCPTDYSQFSTHSLQYAKQLAIGFGARLLVLHADLFLPPPHFTSAQIDELIRSLQQSKEAAQDHLAEYVKNSIGDSTPAEFRFAEDTPVAAILATAAEKNVDLIVMGTHGRSGLTRTMMGSVTERVIRETDRPVLVVRQQDRLSDSSEGFIRHILCPVNFTEVAQHVLEYAASVAERFKASLSVVHVIEKSTGESEITTQVHRLCDWIPSSLRNRCAMQEVVLQGRAADQILSMSRSGGHDLVVIGAEHKRFFDSTVIGTTTVRVIRHAPCPVLTIFQKQQPSSPLSVNNQNS